MQIPPGKKIYFLSDFHLGAPNHALSLEREKRIIQFLEDIKEKAAAIIIVGDLFDFWYEYRKVVPKGYVRVLGQLGRITDAGIPVYFFVGNHDMWMRGYFEEELNIAVYHEPTEFEWNGKKFLIGHGDGLGPGDHGYKFLKKIFRNRFCQWLFGILPPAAGMGLANYLSRESRAVTGQIEEEFLGEENEWLVIYCKEILQKKYFDYLIFGHRHLPIDFKFKNGSRYINLGDWIRYDSYAVYDGEGLVLSTQLPAMESKIVKIQN
jgi:UDP-2,3-diacylglucosamine hydrolase